MSKAPSRIHPSVGYFNLGHFRGPAGPAAFIAPIADDENGWIVVDYVAEAAIADLEIVLATAETVIVTSDVDDLIAAVADLASRGERVVLLEYDGAGPRPRVVVDALVSGCHRLAKHKPPE